jgi:hypothetical protein
MYVSQNVFSSPSRNRKEWVAYVFSELPVTTKPVRGQRVPNRCYQRHSRDRYRWQQRQQD